LGNCEAWYPSEIDFRIVTFYYIHIDFPLTIRNISAVIMFADDTNILISKNNYDDFKQVFNLILSTWFHPNQLILNVEKTNIVNFNPTKFSHYPFDTEYVGNPPY